MPAPSLKMDHVALPSGDVSKTHRFYRDIMQFTLLDVLSGDDWGGHPWLMMIWRAPDLTELALIAFRGQEPRRLSESDIPHLSFAVDTAAELDRWRRRLDEHCVPFREEDHGKQQSIYFVDPAGTSFEITTPPSAGLTAANPHALDVLHRWTSG